jgi:hypothetical protein
MSWLLSKNKKYICKNKSYYLKYFFIAARKRDRHLELRVEMAVVA